MKAFLTSFNQLSWLKPMAEQCVRLGLEPVIFDNASTYEPLVEWLRNCPYPVIQAGSNTSCYGFWQTGLYKEQAEPYVVSDSDLDLSGVPNDAVAKLAQALADNPDVAKAGLSLEYEDIPDSFPDKVSVLAYETNYWKVPRPGGFLAGVGATFALYLPERHGLLDADFYNAVRLDRPYTAKHLPWYLDVDNLSDEMRQFYAKCDNTSHWSNEIRKRLAPAKESKPECQHKRFNATVNTKRHEYLQDSRLTKLQVTAELEIECTDCGRKFPFANGNRTASLELEPVHF